MRITITTDDSLEVGQMAALEPPDWQDPTSAKKLLKQIIKALDRGFVIQNTDDVEDWPE